MDPRMLKRLVSRNHNIIKHTHTNNCDWWLLQPRLVAAAAMPDVDNTENFPYLSQQNNVTRVASQVSESLNNSLGLTNPSDYMLYTELNSIRQEFLNIPNIRETLSQLHEVMTQLKNTDANDHQARLKILMAHIFDLPQTLPTTSSDSDFTMISCVLWNAQSLQSKLSELSRFVEKNKIQIVAVTETRGKPLMKFHLPLFNCSKVDRPHGDIALFIYKSLKFKISKVENSEIGEWQQIVLQFSQKQLLSIFV
jgi:hypothetical protein